ncbi:MAG: MFS transporter, partial [Firmicutes bacterium]|nr:MFS transporter [Bacillota bacterium]
DLLIAQSGGKKSLGRSFGLHKMLDALGAAIGVGFSFLILRFISDTDYRIAIALATIPSAIGVIILFFVKNLEIKKSKDDELVVDISCDCNACEIEKTEPIAENVWIGAEAIGQNEEFIFDGEKPPTDVVVTDILNNEVIVKSEIEVVKQEVECKKQSRLNELIQKTKQKLQLDKRLTVYLIVVFVFCIGKFSKALLLLRALESGYNNQSVMLVYLLLLASTSILSIPFGRLSDRIGRKTVVVLAYFVFSIVYFGFAFWQGIWAMPVLFFGYGIFSALITGAEKAMLVELSPKKSKGTVLGLFGTAQGFGLFLSSIIAGALWTAFGGWLPFVLSGTLGIAAAITLMTLKIGKKSEN